MHSTVRTAASVLILKATKHEAAGAKEVNPKTGKTVKGGQFAPGQGSLLVVAAAAAKLTATQEKQVETALTSGQATIAKDGRKWALTVKPAGRTRSRAAGTFATLADARRAVLPELLGKNWATKKLTAYSDVGAKIGGARKDIGLLSRSFESEPSEFGLQEIEKQDTAAASRLCKKATIWKPESLEDMRKAGASPAFAYAVHALYGLLAPKPLKDEPSYRAVYMSAVQSLKDIVGRANGDYESLQAPMKEWRLSTAASLNVGTRIYRGNGVYEDSKPPTLFQAQQALQAAALGDKFQKWIIGRKNPTLHGHTASFNWLLGKPGEDGVGATHLEKPGGTWYYANGKMQPRTVPEQWKAAAAWLGEKEPGEQAERTEKRLTLEQARVADLKERMAVWERTAPLKHERIGGKSVDVRRPEEYQSHFGLRGLEFGNWMDDANSRQNVERCAEAFQDLADVLGFKAKQISLNGRLALAFGARGSGRFAAHYEPHKVVINLTKTGGAGSLAHEWGHFLDHTIHRIEYGNPASMDWASHGGLKDDPVQHAVTQIMNIIHRGEGKVEYIPNPDGVRKGMTWPNIDRFLTAAKNDPQKALDAIKAAYRGTNESKIKQIADYLATKTKAELVQVPTSMSEYKARMMRISPGADSYWTRPHEMFARCFEAYVQDKLAAKHRGNNYLVRNDKADTGSPLPRGEERKRLNAEFEKLFEAIRSTHMLEKAVELLRFF